MHLAAGDPERAMGLLGSRTVFSAMGSGFPWGQGQGTGLLWGQGPGIGQSRAPCSG